MFKKRVLSFLMACCMTLTLLPSPLALADDDSGNALTDAEAVMVELSDGEEAPADADAAQETEETPVVGADAALEVPPADADAAQAAEETPVDTDAAQVTEEAPAVGAGAAEETPVDADTAQEAKETPIVGADAAQEAKETPIVGADAAQEAEETPVVSAGAAVESPTEADTAQVTEETPVVGAGAAVESPADAKKEEDTPDPSDPDYWAWKARTTALDDGQATLLVAGGSIQNEYIRVIVNSSGNFVIYTVEGNPASTSDNNKRLLYDSTSRTLVRIDNRDYMFGSYITDITFAEDESSCVSTAVFGDTGVTVRQIFTLEVNPFTQLADNVGIRYTCENTSDTPKEVGLQIKMDTMLGSNDSSPFYVNGEGFTTQVEFTGDDIPQYWQSFDRLENPTVVGFGTFYLSGADRPDKVQFGNYGRLVTSSSWDITVNPGEQNGDSAVAVHFNPRALEPGEIRNVGTYYGVSAFSDEYENMNPPLGVKVMTPPVLFIENEEQHLYANNPFMIDVYYTNNGTQYRLAIFSVKKSQGGIRPGKLHAAWSRESRPRPL